MLEFAWTDNSGKGIALGTEKAFVEVYNEEKNHWLYALALATRSSGTCTLNANAFSGKAVQTYIGFISADGKDATELSVNP